MSAEFAAWLHHYLAFNLAVAVCLGAPLVAAIWYFGVRPQQRDLDDARRRVANLRQSSPSGSPSAAMKASK